MNYFSEKDIRDIITGVMVQQGLMGNKQQGMEVPVEISAKHVHLTTGAVEALYGKGASLTPKRALSQPGQFLSEERIKIVTQKGEMSNVAVLGPVRPEIQVELSLTDARTLGINAPVRLSGHLDGAADVILVGPCGVVYAKGSAIVSMAHVHMTPEDAARYGVADGESVDLKLPSERPVTINNVLVRVSKTAGLAVHIDYDEANAAQLPSKGCTGYIVKKG